VQVSVVGRHGEVPADLKQYVETKMAKLPRFYNQVMMIEVIFDGRGTQRSVEIVVSAARTREFVANELGDDYFACFDLCFDKIEAQIRKHKEKVRDHKHVEKRVINE